MSVIAKLISFFTLIISLPFASATFSIARCCTLAVRTEFQKYYTEYYPWEVCNLNKEIDYSTNTTFPSIMKPMSWAKQFCRGTQYSNLRQWLQPLATYISPYIGLLLLCPIGKDETDKKNPNMTLRGKLPRSLGVLIEYLSILGDPASAVFGAVTEIYADTTALYSISSEPSLPPKARNARWVAALAGALKFSSETDWSPVAKAEPYHKASESGLLKAKGSETINEVNNSLSKHGSNSEPKGDEKEKDKEEEIRRAITLCIVARTSFASAILIPVVLMLAVTAATFYDAYAKKGDKDTGLALAYCVWYSWILVPAVAGNCFATAMSPELARRAFRELMDFGEGERVIVALRDRHVNNRFWSFWLRKQEEKGKPGQNFHGFVNEVGKDVRFWALFVVGQLMGWCLVAVATGAATAIAWTTPTEGLGCRSFNFILYGILGVVNAILHVVCSWLSVRSRRGYQFEKSALANWVGGAYWFLVLGNSLVMVLGTLFHLVGVFRTCWCDRLTWNDDTMIELNSKTAKAVKNADKYWISTAYVVFTIMTLVCLLAIVFRQIISRRMDDWVAAEEKGKDKTAGI